MAAYVIADVHNSLEQLDRILEEIDPKPSDTLYFLGDLFDRGGADPDPVGVYFRVLGLKVPWIWIRGNHDQWLADYIYEYYSTPEKKRIRLEPYRYNTFALMKSRLTEADLLHLADTINGLPLQVEVEIGPKKYLLSHAMTADPRQGDEKKELHLMGTFPMDGFFCDGTPGYISVVGHTDTLYMRGEPGGSYLDKEANSIWRNDRGNCYMIDCGCGLPGGRLACMCLETGERYYA